MRLLINDNLKRFLCILSCIFCNKGYTAVSQFLNDNFFQNPAELSIINQSQFTLGAIFINPSAHYKGYAKD